MRKEKSQPVDTTQIRRGTWVKLRLEGRHERIIKSINMMNKLHLTGATSYSLGIGITVSAKISAGHCRIPTGQGGLERVDAIDAKQQALNAQAVSFVLFY